MSPAASAVFLGYDPGGNGGHGVAAITERGGQVPEIESATVATVDRAIAWLADHASSTSAALGIDTLTTWSTGPSGWRPADRWLRATYPSVLHSVASPNSLRGSMAVGGMAMLLRLRQTLPALIVSETHPKVLCFALTGKKYDFVSDKACAQNVALRKWLGVPKLAIDDDHQWDALVSAFAVREGVHQRWPGDLHVLPTRDNEELVRPAGETFFYWPTVTEAVSPSST